MDHDLAGRGIAGVEYRGRIYGAMECASQRERMHEAVAEDFEAWKRRIASEIGKTSDVAIRSIADREAASIPPLDDGGLRDMISAATRGLSGMGHTEDYWGKTGDYGASTEAFAHFMECAVANPPALDTLKRYFPKSYKVFLRVMEM